MNGKTWRRRLGKLAFPDPADASGDGWLEGGLQRLSPHEREELADLRDRLDEDGLEGLTDDELERLGELVTIFRNDDSGDGSLG